MGVGAVRSGMDIESFVENQQGETLPNAAIGAAASVVLSFTGVGVPLGGGIAGYLENRGGAAGAKVGAMAGAIASLPIVFLAWLGFVFLGLFAGGAGEPSLFFGGAVFVVMLGFVVVVTVGMGALGGLVGGLIAAEESKSRQEPGRSREFDVDQ